MASPQDQLNIITGSIPDSLVVEFLEKKLISEQPHSLTLYRRCQAHLKNVYDAQVCGLTKEQHAEVWVARATDMNSAMIKGFDPSAVDGNEGWLRGDTVSSTLGGEWLAAHINLTNPGETSVWLYGSWEAASYQPEAYQPSPLPSSAPEHAIRRRLFQALYDHLRHDHIPTVSETPSARWQTLADSGKAVAKPYSRDRVLFGAVSEALWPYFADEAVRSSSASALETENIYSESHWRDQSHRCIAREDRAYLKYLLQIPPPPTTIIDTQPPPPAGFTFGPLSDAHLQLMLDRSGIPRTIESLRAQVSVGLFRNDEEGGKDGRSTESSPSPPIGWGLLSRDASISSLHVEPEYRGRGIAHHITTQLMWMQPQTFHSDYPSGSPPSTPKSGPGQGQQQNIWIAHTDVSEKNLASRRVFEKMEACVGWRVAWLDIDLALPSP